MRCRPHEHNNHALHNAPLLVPASRVRQGAAFARLHRTTRMPPRVCCSGPVCYTLAPRAVADAAAEVDSREWHLSPEHWERTLARHRKMTRYGIRVMHVTPGQIARNPKAVVWDLAGALAAYQGRSALPITARPAR
jgi:hypothetical protein